MKDIIVIYSGGFGRKEIKIDDYNFIFEVTGVRKDIIEKKVGSIEKYARAIYMLIEKNDPTLLNDIGYIFYTNVNGDYGHISSSLDYFTSNSKISDIILEMQSPNFYCCKEMLGKISELYFYEMKNK